MPKVSVVIPVYNAEKYLKRCVESVLSQSLKDIEIILVDDGSKDDSGNICDGYMRIDNRIHVIHQENKGVSAARNAGIDIAQGEYIAFLDSDDYVDREMYSDLSAIADQEEVDIVYGNYVMVKGDGSIQSNEPYLPANRRIEQFEMRRLLISENSHKILWFVWKSIFRRSWLEKESIRFVEGVIVEDTPFNLETILASDAVWFTDKAYYKYVQTPSSIIRGAYKSNLCDRMNNCYKARKALADKYKLEAYQSNLIQYNMKHSIVMLLANESQSTRSVHERVEALRKIRECDLVREAFEYGSIFCVKSRIRWIMLLLKWRLYLLVAILLKMKK